MPPQTLPNRDSQGIAIEVGSEVEILTIPSWLTHGLPPDEALALNQLEGTRMRVVEIDAYGYVWFSAKCGAGRSESGQPSASGATELRARV